MHKFICINTICKSQFTAEEGKEYIISKLGKLYQVHVDIEKLGYARLLTITNNELKANFKKIEG